ncbi:hypothetical protein D9M72_514640 [compost metagenome]
MQTLTNLSTLSFLLAPDPHVATAVIGTCSLQHFPSTRGLLDGKSGRWHNDKHYFLSIGKQTQSMDSQRLAATCRQVDEDRTVIRRGQQCPHCSLLTEAVVVAKSNTAQSTAQGHVYLRLVQDSATLTSVNRQLRLLESSLQPDPVG